MTLKLETYAKRLEFLMDKIEESIGDAEFDSVHVYCPGVFYCDWLPESTEFEQWQKKECKSCYPYCCMNHYFGLPTIKYEDEEGRIWESEPIELHGYQKEWIEETLLYAFWALVKCRGSGGTEILVVRWFLYCAITNFIVNRKWLITAGTSGLLSKDILGRIKKLADKRPYFYKRRPVGDTPSQLFIGVSKIIALAADPEAVTGFENVGGIALDESAKWDLNNDQPVLDAAEPHVSKSAAHLIVLSTPKKRRGFFWTKIFNPEIRSKYKKHSTNYEVACAVDKPLIDIKKIMEIRATDPETFEQEFNCGFVVPSDSLFGKIEEKNVSKDFKPILL